MGRRAMLIRVVGSIRLRPLPCPHPRVRDRADEAGADDDRDVVGVAVARGGGDDDGDVGMVAGRLPGGREVVRRGSAVDGVCLCDRAVGSGAEHADADVAVPRVELRGVRLGVDRVGLGDGAVVARAEHAGADVLVARARLGRRRLAAGRRRVATFDWATSPFVPGASTRMATLSLWRRSARRSTSRLPSRRHPTMPLRRPSPCWSG